jgi:hypothetical protein
VSATIPDIVYQGSRRFVLRSAKDRYIAELAGIPYDPPPGPDSLIPIKKFAADIGVTVRTVERRVAELAAAPAK